MEFAIPFAVILFPLVALVMVIIGVVVVIRAFLQRGESARLNREEEEALRRLMDAVQKMESRIVNLETILLERSGSPEREWERKLGQS